MTQLKNWCFQRGGYKPAAEHIGVPPRSLASWSTCQRMPREKTAALLIKKTGLDCNAIFGPFISRYINNKAADL